MARRLAAWSGTQRQAAGVGDNSGVTGRARVIENCDPDVVTGDSRAGHVRTRDRDPATVSDGGVARRARVIESRKPAKVGDGRVAGCTRAIEIRGSDIVVGDSGVASRAGVIKIRDSGIVIGDGRAAGRTRIIEIRDPAIVGDGCVAGRTRVY